MNLTLISVFYAAVAVATLWLALLWCARLKPSRRTRIVKVLIGVATVALLFVPVRGLPLWSRAFSFYPNPSLPLLGIICAALWQRLLGLPVFKPADWRAVWWFGVIGGTVLYLHPFVFGGVDLYFWGWDRGLAVWSLAATTVVLLATGSRLGILLLAALLAYAVNALESQNCWDYVMDPFYWLISIAVVGSRAFMWALGPWLDRSENGKRKPAVESASFPVGALQAVEHETLPHQSVSVTKQ
jgi:hypothetical protein